VGKTKKHQQLLLLEPEKADILKALAAKTRIAKQVLLREAVDDLLKKHGMLKEPKRKP
jgi:Ribbon-helix-helix domain